MSLRWLSEAGAEIAERSWEHRSVDLPLADPRFGAIAHVVVCDDQGGALWDQPVWTEPVGGVAVPVDARGRVLLIEPLRRVLAARDAPRAFPPTELGERGRRSLELPRGFAEPGEEPAAAVQREVEEELGLVALGCTALGSANPNTTYFLDDVPVFEVRVGERSSDRSLDEHEDVGRIRRVAPGQLRGLIASGAIRCGMSLAALMLWWAARVEHASDKS